MFDDKSLWLMKCPTSSKHFWFHIVPLAVVDLDIEPVFSSVSKFCAASHVAINKTNCPFFQRAASSFVVCLDDREITYGRIMRILAKEMTRNWIDS